MIKQYYYALWMIFDLQPWALEGEDFDILKLLKTVKIQDLLPHTNDVVSKIFSAFEAIQIEDIEDYFNKNQHSLITLESLTKYICVRMINSLKKNDNEDNYKSLKDYLKR